MAEEVILRDKNGNEQYPITGSQQVFRNGTATTVETTLQTLETGLEEAQPKEEGKGLSTNDYNNEEKQKVANALLKTEQALSEEDQGQVQENIGVKSIVDVVGAGEIREIQLEIAEDNKLRRYTGLSVDADGAFISKPIRVNKGDVLFFKAGTTVSYSLLSEVDADNTFIEMLIQGKEGRNNYKHYMKKDCYISLSASKPTFTVIIIPCDLVAQLVDNGEYWYKLVESYGAVRNEETGYWSLNGFNDITDEEMWNIYRYFNFNDMTMFAGRYPENGNLKIRTNIPFGLTVQNSTNSFFVIPHKWSYLCVLLKYVEKVVLSTDRNSIFLCADNFNGVNYLFYNCDALVEVDGIIDISRFDGILNYVFINCPKLKSFKLKGVHTNATFTGSPLINLSTFTYIVENATNTKAIIIRVTAETYSYLTGTAEPTDEVGGTTEEWQALVTVAAEKQISFATV